MMPAVTQVWKEFRRRKSSDANENRTDECWTNRVVFKKFLGENRSRETGPQLGGKGLVGLEKKGNSGDPGRSLEKIKKKGFGKREGGSRKNTGQKWYPWTDLWQTIVIEKKAPKRKRGSAGGSQGIWRLKARAHRKMSIEKREENRIKWGTRTKGSSDIKKKKSAAGRERRELSDSCKRGRRLDGRVW